MTRAESVDAHDLVSKIQAADNRFLQQYVKTTEMPLLNAGWCLQTWPDQMATQLSLFGMTYISMDTESLRAFIGYVCPTVPAA